jgi:Ca-activated chloride channel family protein
MLFMIAPLIFAGPSQSDKRNPQKPPEQARDEPLVKIGTDLVQLDVVVFDRDNKPVADLGQNSFQVFEDKVAQKIEFFSREQAPVSMVFVIDTSRSMLSKLETVIKASINLARDCRPGDELAVIEFKERAELLEEFTSDFESVVETLQNLVASRQTAMLDALFLAADYANKEGKNRKKAIILVTDGLDRDSYYRFDEVVGHLRQADVQVYLVGFTGDLSKDGSWVFGKSEKDKAERLLNKLADETGGRAFYPRELAEVRGIAEQIKKDLRMQYAIGYYPTNSKKDGSYRTIKVDVAAGNQRLVARHRSGYTAQREGEHSGNIKDK